jgi:transitional endoplasmic reticulum ATPase
MPNIDEFSASTNLDLNDDDCVKLTDFEFDAMMASISGTRSVPFPQPAMRVNGLIEPHGYLCIGNHPVASHVTLIDTNPDYWTWLRLVMLRGVDIAISMGFGPVLSEKNLDRAATLMKIGNAQGFAQRHGEQGLRDALQALLPAWEAEISTEPVFPAQLHENLKSLAKLIGLDPTEKAILGLTVLLYSENVLNSVQNIFGSIQAHQVPRLLSCMLCIPLHLVEKALDPDGALARSDLLKLDNRGSGELSSRMDLISGRFAGRMLRSQPTIFGVLVGLVESVPPPELNLHDYRFMAERIETVTRILTNALDTGRAGVNILVWGRPGLGKSQLARVIAHSLGRKLIQIATQNGLGSAHSSKLRFKIFRMAQAMFDPREALLLFDECEEVLNPQGDFSKDPDDHAAPQKALIHEALETNRVPTIWVCNSIADLTAAQIRRFDICLKMEAPIGVHRQEMFGALAGDAMSSDMMQTLTKNRHMTPAIMSKTAMLVKLIVPAMENEKRDPLVLQLINDKLIATGHPAIKLPNKKPNTFRPEFVNTTLAIDKVLSGLRTHQTGRFLLHGPAGTGKSAFGKWVAEELGVAHLIFRSSALLGKYVGETEANIASAFEQATRESSLLQIDEIDTFLDDRSTTKNAWQVSMANEMLTQIESFEGLLVTTTNLFATIDDAAKRRFDLNLEFSYLRPDDAAQLFQETCEHFKLEAATIEVLRMVRDIRNLTAGDFQQVIGQSRFIQPQSCNDLLERFKECSAMKKFGHTTKMGFLRAAA